MERRVVPSTIVQMVRQKVPALLDHEDLVVRGRLLAKEFGIEERRLLKVFEPRMGWMALIRICRTCASAGRCDPGL